MKFGTFTGISAALVAGMLWAGPAAAKKCVSAKHCSTPLVSTNIIGLKNAAPRHRIGFTVGQRKHVRLASSHTPYVLPANRQRVVALIKQMAPRYGVPTWFALRIAKVESGYNPNARGRAGEYGVFQMKCATARLVGYRGGCRGLLNAGTNVQWGLKHLSLAVRSSRGNLRLAASKHNGGLGMKRLVRAYVRRVF
jgi:soluble lytic murein transglycosylase-like protein